MSRGITRIVEKFGDFDQFELEPIWSDQNRQLPEGSKKGLNILTLQNSRDARYFMPFFTWHPFRFGE